MFDLATTFFDNDFWDRSVMDRRITLDNHPFFGNSGLHTAFKSTETDEYQLTWDLPGYKKEEVTVQLTDRTLVVSAAKAGASRTKNLTTSLPEDLDVVGMSAALDLGVLTVTAAKLKPAQPKTCKIPVK